MKIHGFIIAILFSAFISNIHANASGGSCNFKTSLDYWSKYRLDNDCGSTDLVDSEKIAIQSQLSGYFKSFLSDLPYSCDKNSACDKAIKNDSKFNKECFNQLDNYFGSKPETLKLRGMCQPNADINCEVTDTRDDFRADSSFRDTDDFPYVATKCSAIYTCKNRFKLYDTEIPSNSRVLVNCRGDKGSCDDISIGHCPALESISRIEIKSKFGSGSGSGTSSSSSKGSSK
ncbi:MAG: hypothetical protein ABL927_09695 [Bdellovibrionales bacterium]